MNKFSVYEHLERIEKAYLEILETRQPISQSITLWWGLDGLRLNEDGTLEWISRKKCKQRPNNDLIHYENEMEKLRDLYRMASQINAPSLAMQTIMSQMQTVQNAAIISQLQPPMPGYLGYSPLASPLQQCCIQYPTQYPAYYYGGCCRLN